MPRRLWCGHVFANLECQAHFGEFNRHRERPAGARLDASPPSRPCRRENGAGRPPTPTQSWVFDPATKPGAGARPGRVTHCCFEHAGQNFGSLDRGPRAIRLKCRYGWRTSELKSKSSRKPNPVDPVAEEIPDTEHELVIERVAAIDVAKASGTVCLRLAGKSGRRVSRVWAAGTHSGWARGAAEQLHALRRR
jgi:hypothetical protein